MDKYKDFVIAGRLIGYWAKTLLSERHGALTTQNIVYVQKIYEAAVELVRWLEEFKVKYGETVFDLEQDVDQMIDLEIYQNVDMCVETISDSSSLLLQEYDTQFPTLPIQLRRTPFANIPRRYF